MSDRPSCVCPRPTIQIEQALDRITEYEKSTVIWPELRRERAYLERQLEVAQARPGPMTCVVCRGVRE